MDQNTIQIWGIIGTWVASIGTVSAVIISLLLAYNKGKLKLKVTAGHRLIVTPGFDSRPEYCCINVVNTVDRPAKITSVGWQTGSFKNKKFFLQIFGTPGFDDVPKVLHEGEEANFKVPLRLKGNDEDWIVRLPMSLVGDEGKIRHIKKLKVVLATSVGQMFRTRVEDNLVKKLLESYEANKAN
jgi:hypothetical protein